MQFGLDSHSGNFFIFFDNFFSKFCLSQIRHNRPERVKYKATIIKFIVSQITGSGRAVNYNY